MSYKVAVVNFRLPAEFDSAWKLINPVIEEKVKEVPKIYQDFHDQLTKIYPCVCSLSNNEIDDSVWDSCPLIDSFRVKAPVMEFATAHANEIAPIVLEVALRMGLSVLDWHTKKVYNP